MSFEFGQVLVQFGQEPVYFGQKLVYLDRFQVCPYCLSIRGVPGPISLTRMHDKKRTLSEEIPVSKEPVSEELGRDVVMDDDLLTQQTQREDEESMGMKEEPEGRRKNTDLRCTYTKKGRCKIHGDGARKIPIMVKESVVGEGGIKTTKSIKKYVWRCDINKRGNKMIQSSISSFLSKKNPENTGGVAGTSDQQRDLVSCSKNTVGQRADTSSSLPHSGGVERFGDYDERNTA